MPTVDVRGARLYYEQHGTAGDPTVLVHGSLADSSTWERVVPKLARALSVLTYDRRGYGRSSVGGGGTPVATDTEDLAALLEATDFYPVHLVAHSYGAVVGLRLAEERPELVRSLCLHEPPFFGLLRDRPETADLATAFERGIEGIRDRVAHGDRVGAARAVVEVFGRTPGAWERLPEAFRRSAAASMDRWVEEYRDPDAWRPRTEGSLGAVVPVLLTVGGESPPFLREIETVLSARLPFVTRRTMAGVSHAPHVTSPDTYVGLLLLFLLERNVPEA